MMTETETTEVKVKAKRVRRSDNWGGHREGAGRKAHLKPEDKRKHRAVSANNDEWVYLKPIIIWLKANPDELKAAYNQLKDNNEI